MDICIDVRSTVKKKTGVGYYTLNLINALARIDTENTYWLYSQIKPFSFTKRPPPLPGPNFKHKIERRKNRDGKLPYNFDVYHSSSFELLPADDTRLVAVVHDIIPQVFPQGHTKDAISRLHKKLQNYLDRASAVIVDSKCSKNDLVTHFNVAQDRVKVVYPGVGEDFAPASKSLYKLLQNKYNICSNYILYIGTIEPRKNIKGLIKAFGLLKAKGNIAQKLVIVGMKGWMSDDIYRLADKFGLDSEVIFTGYVPREHLKIFYSFADVLVFPSFYEGAGLPVLEAFACGTPVVSSNVSSIPELAGDAALLVDPYSPQKIAEAIERVLTDNALSQQMIEKGLQRAKEFSWDRTAQQTLKVVTDTF